MAKRRKTGAGPTGRAKAAAPPPRGGAARASSLSSLTRLAADWYWEQDSRYRLTYLSKDIADKTGLSDAAYLGRTRWDWPALNLTEADWERHRAQLARRETFRDFELHRVRGDGHGVWLSISGEPVFDSRGRFRGYRGIGRDITGQKREEQLRELEHAASRHFAQAESTAESIKAALRTICETEHWECGRYLRVDTARGVLRFGEAWSVSSPNVERYVEASRTFLYAPWVGLVGNAWQTGQPVWAPDIAADPRVARPALARETGMQGAFAVPVIVGGDTTGVLIFQSRQLRRPDQRFVQAIGVIATQIGQLMLRSEAREALQASEERFRQLAELSSDWYWEQDENFRFIERIGERVRDSDARPERYVGLTRWEANAASLTAEQWAAHRAVLEAHRPFHDFEYQRPSSDGTMHWVSVSGRPVFDGEGRFRGYRGVGKNITARKLADQALRESEARFRSLTHLSSDWYWEQDAQYRFTRIEGRHAGSGAPGLNERLMGNRRWETGLQCEGGWDAHIALLESRKPFHDVLMFRAMEDGGLRYLRVSGEPVFDAERRFAGYRGVGRNVSAEKRAEQMLRLEHQVGSALSEAQDQGAGVRVVLRALCEAEGPACARYFAVDEAHGVLRFQDGWCTDPDLQKFLEQSRPLTYRPARGLAGRVWHTGEPVWSADTLDDPRVEARHLASTTGTRAACVFPVSSEGRRVGVISISSRHVRRPDERLLQALRVIGGELGQFLQRKRAEDALRESEARFRSLTEMSSDFFWETDPEHRFTQFVHGKAKLSRLVLGKSVWELPSNSPVAAAWANLRKTVEAYRPFRELEFGLPRPNGGPTYFSVSGEPRFAADGTFLGYRGVGRDITEVVLAREHIASLAYSDPLTGLKNRSGLAPAFEQAIERARRRGDRLAAMFVDLDGFKQINDRHGHQAGDRFLVEIARRLRASLRASDLLARLGGDEFFVVLEDQQEAEALETVARKILGEVLRAHEIAPGADARVSASIGIAVFPGDGQDAFTLMKHADTAMYQAKQSGKNALRFYAPQVIAAPARNESDVS